MKTSKLKTILIMMGLLAIQTVHSQDGDMEYQPGDEAASNPCIQSATTWYIGGNNIVPLPYTNGGGSSATPGNGLPSSWPPANLTDIGTCNDYPFILKANNNLAVWILQNGNVGIGSAVPTVNLEVNDPNDAKIVVSSGQNKPAGVWAVNSDPVQQYSNGLRNDINGVGHISTSISNPKDIINFRWNSTYNIPQAWIGGRKPTNSHADFSFSVDGKMEAKSVYVQVSDWADKVFERNYPLRKLSEVEIFYKEHKHLPEIPSEKEVLEKGVDVGEMNKLLLQKVEELTLYSVEQMHKYEELKKELEDLKKQVNH